MARVSIVTSGHISTNPRVWREADALAGAGYDVTVIGVRLDSEQAELDEQMLSRRCWRFSAAADLRSRPLWHRYRARLGRTLLSANVHDPYALGYAVDRILDCALKAKADLTICHLEVATWVGTQLHKRGLRVGVDIEDWYSESGPDTTTPRSRFLHALEREILNTSVHATTTSHAMADALKDRYQCRKPQVVYNSTPCVPAFPSSVEGPVRLMWFSQTLGRDRGLQDLFRALPLLKGEWTLELLANSSNETRAWAESFVAPELRSRVHIRATVPPDALSYEVSKCDIGLALEPPSCGNKSLTIANKMFQYLQCGLQVVASDTSGQREVLKDFPHGGSLYSSGDTRELADLLNFWLVHPKELRATKQSIASEANQRFAYEVQASRLLESVSRGLEW